MKSKSELRATLVLERSKLSVAEVIEKSELILSAVQTILQNLSFKTLHCYEPIATLREVDVSQLLDLPDAKMYTSRKIGGEWQIVAITNDAVQTEPQLDVIIVPLLGFDQKLQRIGYGGGYYDRLLAQYPNALKIGVCYEQGRLEAVPTGPHDIPLNLIVTDVTATIAV